MEAIFEMDLTPGQPATFKGNLAFTAKYLYIFGRSQTGEWADINTMKRDEHDPFLDGVSIDDIKIGGESKINSGSDVEIKSLPACVFGLNHFPVELKLGSGSVFGNLSLDSKIAGGVRVKVVFRSEPYTVESDKPAKISNAFPLLSAEAPLAKQREYIVGMKAVDVEPGVNHILSSDPICVKDFVIRSIIVPEKNPTFPGHDKNHDENVAPSFEIHDVLCDGVSLLLSPLEQPEPCVSFSSRSVRHQLSMGPCRKGSTVQVVVKNTSGKIRKFTCAFFGVTSEPWQALILQ